MRSSFFKGDRNRAIKIADRVMLVFLAGFILLIASLSAINFTQRKFLYPIKFEDSVYKYADEYNLDRAFVFAVIKVESRFNARAKSSKGALGLMQITPKTGEYIAKLLSISDYDLLEADTNIKFGCFYYRYLLNKFLVLGTAVCAYNAGEGNVEWWLKNSEYSEDGIMLKNVPFAETKEYRKKIKQSYKKYSELYENIVDKKQNFE